MGRRVMDRGGGVGSMGDIREVLIFEINNNAINSLICINKSQNSDFLYQNIHFLTLHIKTV